MKYVMVLVGVGALLLSTPALAATSHDETASTTASSDHGARFSNDRDDMIKGLDKELVGMLHNPHCDPDDRGGPDGDRDDHAANNPGRGRHVGRCVGHPSSP